MKLAVDRINEKPSSMPVDQEAAEFPVLADMQADGLCTFLGPVNGEVNAQREYDHIRVAGKVAVPVRLSCSRCLNEFDSELSSRFTIMFRKADSLTEQVDEDETELEEQDLVSAHYSGDEIDLEYEIGEQLAMELPLKPLCGDSCKGLCPTCGIDLNADSCSCGSAEFSLKFSALKDFKVRNTGN